MNINARIYCYLNKLQFTLDNNILGQITPADIFFYNLGSNLVQISHLNNNYGRYQLHTYIAYNHVQDIINGRTAVA